MKEVDGCKINFNFGSLIKISDLIYYDGPLLSYYISDKGENYLFYWVDVDDIYNRWLVVRTDIFSIQQYLEKKIPLHRIISESNDGFLYLVDIDSEVQYHNIQLVEVNNLPEDYIPSKDSYYNFEPTDDIDLAAISQRYPPGNPKIQISGQRAEKRLKFTNID
ncbi:hypothetical protein EZS27_025470 [termite gut metagenome]|uniref:DUF6575 domain-containing protein n=1 Tax=termite gut metagenome TaxID=433724 RepID=A0A5J4QVD5_9ZZZZ